MVDSKRYLDWYAAGRKDLAAAHILKDQGGDHALVCFHCQQAIEKHLKGFILHRAQRLTEGHGLLMLCKACASFEEGFLRFLKDVALVSVYYMETRYPADQPLEVSDEDTEECLTIAELLIAFVEGKS